MKNLDIEIKNLQLQICNYARNDASQARNKAGIMNAGLSILNAILSIRGITSIESALVNWADRKIHLDVNNPLDKKLYMAGRQKISSDDEVVTARNDNRTSPSSVMKAIASAAKRSHSVKVDCREYSSMLELEKAIKAATVIAQHKAELLETLKELTAEVKLLESKKDCNRANSVLRKAKIELRTTTVEVKPTKVTNKKVA
jgi:hypothetical protein